MSSGDVFRIDLRKKLCEIRYIRDCNALLMQYRTSVVELDGSIERGKWVTSTTVANYGDCLDENPTFWQRIFSV